MTVRFQNEQIDKHRPLADAIKDNLVVDKDTIKEKEQHQAYNANLPEGFTPALVKDLAAYNARFVKAGHIAVGEVAAEVMSKDKSVDKVSANIGYSAPSDSLNFTVERNRVYPNPQATGDEPTKITKHLVISMSTDIRGQSVKSIRDAMSEGFKDRFS